MDNLTCSIEQKDQDIALLLERLKKDPEKNKEAIMKIIASQERTLRSRKAHKIYKRRLNELLR